MVGACSRRLSWRMRARGDTADAMYRLLIPVLLTIAAAVAAPQEPNKSVETYVKIQPVNETTFQNLTTVPSSPGTELEPNDSNRPVDGDDDDVTTEDQSEATTEEIEAVTDIATHPDQAVEPAQDIRTRTKTPSPRFFSKLSYFQKPSYGSGPSLTNFLERNSKRKFKSRCRCERIWNCPKLQISVPRCPDEYFMCCF